MKLKVTRENAKGQPVSALILGHNVEMCLTTADGLLSDRLRNPKFVGPPHRMTGVAPEWQGASAGRNAYELTPGAGLMGSEAQHVQMSQPHGTPALHQNKVPVKAGEELVCELWARVRHEPVTLKIALLPLASRSPEYDSGTISIDTSYFKRYTVPLTVSRDDDEARLSLRVDGLGVFWIDQIHLRPKDEPLLCTRIVDEMARMQIPSLRFPGGIVANAYNWQHGTGPVHLRPAMLEAAFHQDWHLNYDFGLDEYLQLCLDQDIVPTLTLNVATGTPEEAEAFATYCANWFRNAGVEPPLIYWHIANHPYHDTTAHMTPDMYAHVLQTFVPRVKDNYPSSRIVAVMGRGGLTGPNSSTPWKDVLIAEHELIDVVQFQQYGGCDPLAEPQTQLEKLSTCLRDFQTDTCAFIAESRSKGANWNVGVAEWNWWHQASHWDGRAFEEPPTVLHGLFIAGTIHRFAAMAPDFEIAHFYNLVNCMGILNHWGAEVEVTDAVEIFKLYRAALPGQRVPLDVATDSEHDVAPVDALCLTDDTHTWLFLTNRDLRESAEVSLSGFNVTGAEVEGFIGTTTTGTFIRLKARPTTDRVEVSPLSILRVKLVEQA